MERNESRYANRAGYTITVDSFPEHACAMLIVSRQLQIPLAEFEITFARSSGPGGQNVNKVNSKALLRWAAGRSPSLPEAVRERFLQKYANRLTNEGELLVTSQRYRDAPRNSQDCLDKLRAMLLGVVHPPETPAGNASVRGVRWNADCRENAGSRPPSRTAACGRKIRATANEPGFSAGGRSYQFFCRSL